VLRRQVVRPALRPADRALLARLSRLLNRRHLGKVFVQPETLLRWHRDLVRRRWTYFHRPGRSSVPCGCRESHPTALPGLHVRVAAPSLGPQRHLD
jgi:hypothetical protein